MQPISPNYPGEDGVKQIKSAQENCHKVVLCAQLLKTKTLAAMKSE